MSWISDRVPSVFRKTWRFSETLHTEKEKEQTPLAEESGLSKEQKESFEKNRKGLLRFLKK